VFAAPDEGRGYRTLGTQLHPKTKVDHGILEKEASKLLKNFFIQKRNLN
jgi:tRNA(adenine34) deaminase